MEVDSGSGAMSCPGGRQNPTDARFCGGCGARLEVACAACQPSNPPGNRFCQQCGVPLTPGTVAGPLPSPRAYTPGHLAERILTSKAVLEGERKPTAHPRWEMREGTAARPESGPLLLAQAQISSRRGGSVPCHADDGSLPQRPIPCKAIVLISVSDASQGV
jgi:Double zinc ribbon